MATQAIEELEAVQFFALFGAAVIMALAHTFIPQLESPIQPTMSGWRQRRRQAS